MSVRARNLGRGVVVVLLFAVAVLLGATVHLSTPRARRLVVGEANVVLAKTLEGRVTIDHVGHLGILGASNVDVAVDSPSGTRVASLHGLRIGVDAMPSVRWALLGRKGPLTIRVSTLSIGTLDVRVDRDPDGRLELVKALTPRTPGNPRRQKIAIGVRVLVPHFVMHHALIRGWRTGARSVDLTLDDVRCAVANGPDALDADIAAAKIGAHPSDGGPTIAGLLQARLRKRSDVQLPSEARLAWTGRVGAVEHTIRASFVNGAVDAVVDVPETSPETIRSVWAASPLDRPIRAHVAAHGPLEHVDIDARAGLGDAALEVTGRVLGGGRKAQVAMNAHGVDVHSFVPSAPHTRLDVTGEALAERSGSGALTGELALHLDAPEAPTELALRLSPTGGSSAVAFRLDSNIPDLRRVTPRDDSVLGSLKVLAEGRVDLTKRTLVAHLRGQAEGIMRGTASVQSASLGADAQGSLEAPKFDVVARLQEMHARRIHLASLEADARGSTKSAHVSVSARGPETPDLDAECEAALGHGLSLKSLRAALARAGERSLIAVRDLSLGNGELTVEDARVEGLGAPLTATLRASPATLSVRASTRGLDLGRVGRLINLEKALRSGVLTMDSDVRLQRVGGQGRVTLDAAHVESGAAKDLSVHADVSLAGRKVSAAVRADVPGAGTIQLEVQGLTAAGSGSIARTAWREWFGSSDVHARLDLAGLAALVPQEDLPLSDAHGEVVLDAHLARDGVADLTPELRLRVATDQLVLAPRVPVESDIRGAPVHPPPPWRIAGVDLALDGDIDGDSGVLHLRTSARDATGPLANLEATLDDVPYADLIGRDARLLNDLGRTRIDARVVIPEHRLGSLPAVLRQRFVTGRFNANVAINGRLAEPVVNATAALRNGRFGGSGTAEPLDVDLSARYEGQLLVGHLKARGVDAGGVGAGGQDVVDAEARVQSVAAGLFAAKRASPAWIASGRAHLASFPIGSFGVLDDKLVSGKLTGDISLEDWHKSARADAKLSVDGLSVGGVSYKAAALRMHADGQTAEASVRIDQADGYIEADAHAMDSWGEATLPSLDAAQPLDASLSAKNFRVAALLPFVDKTLDELDGRLDANAHLQLDPRAKAVRPSGGLTLHGGTVAASAGGGELHDVTANLKLGEDGTVTLEKLSASGVTGKLEATGTAHFNGLALQSARAVLTIPTNSAMPLTVGGSDVGDVDGSVEVSASAEEGSATQVNVHVAHAEVALPEGSTGHPQTLGPMYKVRVGAQRGNPTEFVLLPLDPTRKGDTASQGAFASPAAIAVRLDSVRVVRGKQLKVELAGNMDVSPNPGSRMTGQISVKSGGTLNVQGRTFVIENGTITFQGGDPSNPQVVVKASWSAPDRTVVFATFTGPLNAGKVTLSSQPPLPREEIVQLLLFGSPDGRRTQTASSGASSTAIAALGGEATQPLNHALSQLGLGAVTTKIDTSEAANPKPEVEVQIARDISLAIAVVLGQPPPGVNPDRTLLTLDWRFLSKWSLATTVGDAGTTIFDLLWQRRY